YRENATWVSEPLMRFMHEIGFLDGKFTGRLLRMSRAMPEDILAEIKAR
ncbi:diiron oxygenase, partial [Mycobacteroides abscessus]